MDSRESTGHACLVNSGGREGVTRERQWEVDEAVNSGERKRGFTLRHRVMPV